MVHLLKRQNDFAEVIPSPVGPAIVNVVLPTADPGACIGRSIFQKNGGLQKFSHFGDFIDILGVNHRRVAVSMFSDMGTFNRLIHIIDSD